MAVVGHWIAEIQSRNNLLKNFRVMMTEAYVPVADYGKYYGEVVDQIGSVSQVCPLTL